MKRLKRVGVIFFAKLNALILGAIGAVLGVLYAFGGAAYDLQNGGLNIGSALAFLALVGMPLLFALYGLIAGSLGALVYNLIAANTGGLSLDIEEGE